MTFPMIDSMGDCEVTLLGALPECSGDPTSEVLVWIGLPPPDHEVKAKLCDRCQGRFKSVIVECHELERSA
jgi:hypothetical protein